MLDLPVPRWSTSKRSRSLLSDTSRSAKSPPALMASSPGPPINGTIGSGSAFPPVAGTTATAIRRRRPSGRFGFSGTTSSPQRAGAARPGSVQSDSGSGPAIAFDARPADAANAISLRLEARSDPSAHTIRQRPDRLDGDSISSPAASVKSPSGTIPVPVRRYSRSGRSIPGRGSLRAPQVCGSSATAGRRHAGLEARDPDQRRADVHRHGGRRGDDARPDPVRVSV